MRTFVILAAGNSTRFGRDKLLERVAGETLPQRATRFALDNGAERVCLTVNRSAVLTDGRSIYSRVHRDVSEVFPAVEVSFQDEDKYGPGAAITAWQGKIDDPFTVLFGDNFYDGTIPDLADDELAFSYQYRSAHPRNLQLAALVDTYVVEKPHAFLHGRFFCGFVHFPRGFFSTLPQLSKSGRGEYEITDMINMTQVEGKRRLIDIDRVGYWSDVTYSHDVERIERERG